MRAIAGEPKVFGLWVYGDDQQTRPRLRVVDSKGQFWQATGDDINWTGWRYVEFDLESAMEHWGGVNEDTLHFPLEWDSLFLLDKAQQREVKGTIYVTAPVAIY